MCKIGGRHQIETACLILKNYPTMVKNKSMRSFPYTSSFNDPHKFHENRKVLILFQSPNQTSPIPKQINTSHNLHCRSQWLRVLRRRSTAARLLRLCVRIPPGTRMSFCCECCVLSGRGFYDEVITLPGESYRLWCVVVCDLETW